MRWMEHVWRIDSVVTMGVWRSQTTEELWHGSEREKLEEKYKSGASLLTQYNSKNKLNSQN